MHGHPPPRSRCSSRAKTTLLALVIAASGIGVVIVRFASHAATVAPCATDEGRYVPSADDAPSRAPSTLLATHPVARSAALARTLRHGAPDARAEAARALGEAPPRSDDSALLTDALDDEDADVRAAARRALRRSGSASSDAVASLLRRVAGDDEREAADVLRTLGAVAGDRVDVLDALARAIEGAAPTRARGAAAGLVLAGEPGVACLRATLERSVDAADALRGVVVRAVSDDEEARLGTTLVALLDDPRREVRTFAMRALAAWTGSATSSACCAPSLASIVAATDRDGEERRLAVEALGAIAPAAPSVPDVLRSALHDPDASVRGAAARELFPAR